MLQEIVAHKRREGHDRKSLSHKSDIRSVIADIVVALDDDSAITKQIVENNIAVQLIE